MNQKKNQPGRLAEGIKNDVTNSMKQFHLFSSLPLTFFANRLSFILHPSSFILLLACLVTGCGKVGDPVPPTRAIRAATQQLEVRQKGGGIEVRFPRPARNTNGGAVIRADIFRVTEDINAPAALDQELFIQKARIVGTLRSGQIFNSGPFVTFADPFEPTDASLLTKRFRYAIRFSDENGRPNPLSNYATAYPNPGISETPGDISFSVSQNAVTLNWKAPEKNLDGTPATSVAYNVYRRGKDEAFDQPLNPTPLTEARFADTRFSFGEEYAYTVRAVSLYRGEPIESADTPPVSVKPVDTFPPQAPVNLSGASAAGIVNLFFPASPESDIKGYFIYRTEVDGNGSLIKLTPAPISQTTFQDKKGETGKTYRYRISAVDVFGNESEKSEAVDVQVLP